MNIQGIDKALVLKALYDNSAPIGMGFLSARDGDLSLEEARSLLKKQTYFDYLYGRPLKISLEGDTLNLRLYDRDNPSGETAILELLTQPSK